MDLREIISPIGQDNPCGENIRVTPKYQEKYYRIKDARNAARSVERGASPNDNIRLTPAWHEVNELGLQILSSNSKDIEILAWLAEAQLRLRGFEGLQDSFTAMMSLLDNYWEELHSIGDDDIEERLAPLAGLNGVNGEGSLIQAIRLTSLVPNGGFAQHSLWDYQLAQRAGETERRDLLHEAAAEAGMAAMAAHLAVVNDCIASFTKLAAVLTERCGDRAPPSSNTRNVLQEVAAAIRDLTGLGAEEDVTAPGTGAEVQAPNADSAAPAPSAPRPLTPGSIGSREEAFEILLAVARHFRRTEPHSPISLAIETLVRRGRMDFSELLAELLPEAQTRNAVLTAAGIQAKTEKRDN
ncbi:type VI secretion system protein TssA [Labrys okinawensis]|uniref:Type VI secretion system protein TssA n=1 Tax=Labrys okinawensis TaxID=346911 RepID=A0A2S9QF73_9HYPH|nr:type VI secretion system protein TssA [Labrys okinawensis]PRH88006.1 type VI secretion system protein TssA [Labrys okinawensis]